MFLLQLVVSAAAMPLFGPEFVAQHNANPARTWTAGHTPFSSLNEDQLGEVLGKENNPFPTPSLQEAWPLQATYDRLKAANTTFPEWFDPRHRWHWCPTLYEIRDQGICGSCWAHGVTEALTDRFCTMANITTQLSSTDAAFCCRGCGAGCGGGDPEKALTYLNTSGAFTSTCRPYDQGDHRSAHPWPKPAGRATCPSACDDGETLAATKHFGGKPYNVPHDVDAIKLELLTNGPAGTQMTVYSDFGSYKSGVYSTECGLPPPLGKKCTPWGHAVKILGWGHAMVNITSFDKASNKTVTKLEDTPYWIGANSWSRDWGEGGFFRITHNTVGFDRAIGTQHPMPTKAQRGTRPSGTHPSAEEQLARAWQLAGK